MSLSSYAKSAEDVDDDDVQESLPQLVEKLRKKISLKEKSNKLDEARLDARIIANRDEIQQLRENNNVKHQLLAECEKADEYVIKQVFSSNAEERKAFMHMDAEQVIYYMNERVCSLENARNLLHYDVRRRQQVLSELRTKLDQLNAMRASEHDDGLMEMTKLENDTDKARIKYETALTLSKKYRSIIDKMKGESVSYMSKLETLEAALRDEKRELREMETLCGIAEKERDEMKAKHAEVDRRLNEEKEAAEEDLARAQTLQDELNKAQQRDTHKHKEKMAALSPAGPFAIAMATGERKAKSEGEELEVNKAKERLVRDEELVRRLLEVTQVTKLDDVLPRLQQQMKMAEELKKKVGQLKQSRDAVKEEVEGLQAAYHELKYGRGERMSGGQALLQCTAARVDSQRTELTNQRQTLAARGALLLDAHKGIRCLLEKLEHVRLKPPKHNCPRDDFYYNLDLLTDKLVELQRHVEDAYPSLDSARERYEHFTQEDDFTQFLEKRLPPDNIRVDFKPALDNRSAEYDYDATENSGFLDRSHIKEMSSKILETKSKQPKKRRGRK